MYFPVFPYRQLTAALAVGLLCLGLAGCNRNRDDRTADEPSPTRAATATPAATPRPTPLPTAPALSPAERLAAAERLETNGRLDEAAGHYVVLSQASDPAVAGKALYLLSRLQQAQGQWQRANENLMRFFALADAAAWAADAPFVAEARLIWAQVQGQIGAHDLADANFAAALEGLDELASFIHQEWGQALLARGEDDRGFAQLAQAAARAETRVGRVVIQDRIARLAHERGRFAEATAAYEAILAVSVQPAYRAQIQYRAGVTRLAAQDEAGALARFRAATDEQRESVYAYLALVELIDREQAFDLYDRGYIDYHAQAYGAAVQAFDAFQAQAEAGDDKRSWAALYEAHAHFKLENYVQAMKRYQMVIGEFPDCSCVGAAYNGLLNTFYAVDNDPAYERTWASFAAARPADAHRAQLLYDAFAVRLQQQETRAARQDLQELLEYFPADERSARALFEMALFAFDAGDHVAANGHWAQLRELFPAYRAAAAGYWTARNLWALGNREAARFAWEYNAGKHPENFFGIMSAQALHRNDGGSQNVVADMAALVGPPSALAGDDGSAVFALDWMRTWVPAAAGEAADLDADARLRQGAVWLRLGRRQEAIQAWNAVLNDSVAQPRALWTLAHAFAEAGAHALSIRAAFYLYRAAPVAAVSELPAYVQRLLFPRPFRDLVAPVAAEYGIPEALLYALLRQESLFEPSSVSSAAAQGLGQIMPDTGDWVALQMRMPDYRAEWLPRPWLNLQFSGFYLRYAYRQLDRNWLTALVGYNAGPGNGRFFRDRSGPDDMLFYKAVTIAESALYVERIITHLHHYVRLYGTQAG